LLRTTPPVSRPRKLAMTRCVYTAAWATAYSPRHAAMQATVTKMSHLMKSHEITHRVCAPFSHRHGVR
jgi:hypothetical protein